MVKVIKEEGFEPTLISDQPNFLYEPHQHQEAKLIVCLQGFMKVTVKEKTYDFEPGDMLKIPAILSIVELWEIKDVTTIGLRKLCER